MTTALLEALPGTCEEEWVAGHCIHVLTHADAHKYLGRALSLSKERATPAVKARISAAWHQLQKRRSIFMSQHVNANLRVKLFNSTVLPVMLYGLSSLTLKPRHHSMLKRAQTKMLRNMAGWRRFEGENWSNTMRRMRSRVADLQQNTSSPNVCERLLSLKWRLARRLLDSSGTGKWAPLLLELSSSHQRCRGRPPLQWLDDIKSFRATAAEIPEQKYIEYCSTG